MTYDPNLPPQNDPLVREPVYTETVIVRRESNTGWWIAGGLGAAVLIAVLWILASNGRGADDADARIAEAQADAIAAQAQADQAAVQSQIAGAQTSIEIARSNAAQAEANAIRATAEARAEAARASQPVIITTRAPEPVAPSPSTGAATVTTTSPQP